MNNNLDWWTGSGTRVNGPLVNIYGNANATWEKSKKLNLGVDMTLLESMDITIDYFKEDRSGIFMQRSSVPSTMGVTGMLPYANIGSVKNKGVDMSVAYSKVIGKDWVLRLNGSLTYAHNEITEIDEPVNVEPYSSRIGHPINSIMGYVSDGLFTSQEEIDRSPKQSFGNYTVGDIKYKDLNGDNVVNGYDRTIIGNPEIPEIIYGFGGHNGSKNFCVHYGYADNSGYANGPLPYIYFGDGVARVVDHMYVTMTTYLANCVANGNGLTAPAGKDDWVKLVAIGYDEDGKEVATRPEFYLVGAEGNILEWTKWDLSALGKVVKIDFNVTGSNDNGYGFSQPAYFAYDDVAVRF